MAVKKISLIAKELERFESQIEDVYAGIMSIRLLDIEDPQERLKAATAKQNALKGLPLLMRELEDLRNRNKVKQDDIKGSKNLSPLDDGTLDDPIDEDNDGEED